MLTPDPYNTGSQPPPGSKTPNQETWAKIGVIATVIGVLIAWMTYTS